MHKIDLVYEMTVGDLVRNNNAELKRKSTDEISSNGPVAKAYGVTKATTELTDEERAMRVKAKLNPLMFEDRDYSVTNSVAFNKIYPEGDNTANAIMKSLKQSLTVDSDYILHDAYRTLQEGVKYFQFCMNEKIPVSKSGLTAWYGIGGKQLNRYLARDNEVGLVLQNYIDRIAQIRTLHSDEGKIPVVQHIFEMANSHGYSRNDAKNDIKIQINTNNYSSEEQIKIIDDVVDF